MPDKKHHNMNALKWEKRHLQDKKQRLETEMKERVYYFKEHIGSLAIHTVLPSQGDKVTSAADKIKFVAEKILGTSKERNFLQAAIRNAIKVFLIKKITGLLGGLVFKKYKKAKSK